MALTIANTHPQFPLIPVGNGVVSKVVTVTFDSSYPAGGESFVPSDVGLSEFLCVLPSVDANADLPYVVQYDYTAQKLMAFGVQQDADAATTDVLDEAGDTDNLAALVVRVLVLGA